MPKRKPSSTDNAKKRQKKEEEDEKTVEEGKSVDGELVRPAWTNRERVLVLCSRGSSHRDRHLMLVRVDICVAFLVLCSILQDVRTLLPHSRAESKHDKKQDMQSLVELATLKKCTKVLYFENRKRKDLYMWLASVGPTRGPTCRFLVRNVHTMAELRLSGNCLKGSRPLLSFDEAFDASAHMQLIKELFIQVCF